MEEARQRDANLRFMLPAFLNTPKEKGQRFWTILWVKILYITGILIKAKLFYTIEFEHLLTYFLTLWLHFQVYGNCFPIFLIFLLSDLSFVHIKK